MSYATLEQLIDRYGESMIIGLTDRGTVATGGVDHETIDRALADTDAVIDARIGARYVLPLAEVPPLLSDVALCIAIWKLHRHDTSQKIKDDYAEAMRQLREIGDGTMSLPIATGEPEVTGENGARVTDRDRDFTAETMKGFI